MELKEFAQKYFLRVKRSKQDDTDNIFGRYGEIYDYGDDTLGVMVMPEPPRRGLWVRSRKKFEALGMTTTQNGDQEGAAVFVPANPPQAQAAIKAIQATKMRKLSAVRRGKLVAVGQETRLRPRHMGQTAL